MAQTLAQAKAIGGTKAVNSINHSVSSKRVFFIMEVV
jgi:hypothetical protein